MNCTCSYSYTVLKYVLIYSQNLSESSINVFLPLCNAARLFSIILTIIMKSDNEYHFINPNSTTQIRRKVENYAQWVLQTWQLGS